ncbi:MAG: type II CRISPR-associated endonuclease Cas1 [Deltaproteobacteria bacterium]|nr:type II CRISPR-associated endonuclease Cas1 [Deltaproteobacteria bacterium]
MSFHILHLFDHGSYLRKRAGRLYCQNGESQNSLPIENIKAVIIAAKGLTLSTQLIGALLEHGAIILHCDENYQPVGLTTGITSTINVRIMEGQIRPRHRFRDQLWGEVLRRKISHQVFALDAVGIGENPLVGATAVIAQDEARVARIYFRSFFRLLDARGQTRAQKKHGWLNAYLNYGYAVLSAVMHRSIIVHGLLSNIGIHHMARYRSWPLVYDLMEPLRPVVDVLTSQFIESESDYSDTSSSMKNFAKYVGNSLRLFRVPHRRYSLKLVDAIDFYVRSFANACEYQDISQLWIPSFDVANFEQSRVPSK